MARRVTFRVNVDVKHSPLGTITAVQNLSVFPYWIQDTVDTDFKYMSPAYNNGTRDDIDEAYARAVTDFTINSWSARISAALGVGETLTLRWVIDGVPDATIPISFVEGDQDLTSADGTLAIAKDQLFAIEGVIGGTLTDVVVRGGVVSYSVS